MLAAASGGGHRLLHRCLTADFAANARSVRMSQSSRGPGHRPVRSVRISPVSGTARTLTTPSFLPPSRRARCNATFPVRISAARFFRLPPRINRKHAAVFRGLARGVQHGRYQVIHAAIWRSGSEEESRAISPGTNATVGSGRRSAMAVQGPSERAVPWKATLRASRLAVTR